MHLSAGFIDGPTSLSPIKFGEKDRGCIAERTPHRWIGYAAGAKTKTKSNGTSGTTEATVFWPRGARTCMWVGTHGDGRSDRRNQVLQGNGGWITFRNEAVKPTRNARCWHKIGTVGERCPGSDHYLSRSLLEERTLRRRSSCSLKPNSCQRHDSTQPNRQLGWVELSLTDMWWAYGSLTTRSRRRATVNTIFDELYQFRIRRHRDPVGINSANQREVGRLTSRPVHQKTYAIRFKSAMCWF